MHHLDRNPSPRSYPPLAPSIAAPSPERNGHDTNMYDRTPPEANKNSPRSYGASMPVDEAALMLDRLRSGGNPKVVVKKEPPSSPSMQSGARHRPRKLDLNTNTSSMVGPNSRPSATPMTARETLAIQDVGLACLSPGFQTHDPTMREQLQRSLYVRDKQRSIIEQRMLKSAKGDGPDSSKPTDSLTPGGKPPALSSKKRPPPGLAIVPPAAERFANERVIQSAPLNQTFTGRNDPHPALRQSSGQSNLGPGPQINHPYASQTSNQLPPISNIFAANELRPDNRPPFLHTNSTPAHIHGPPMPSPSYPPQTAHPMSQSYNGFERPREFRSAEEAVHEMTGGREELMPKIVHYGGHQPPTPPSPHPRNGENLTPHKYQPVGFAGRRRSRHEYEEGSSPPLGSGRGPRLGPFGEERDSPATNKAKKERFMTLCAEAWDLFHS